MPEFRVLANERIVVHERRMIFQFDVERMVGGTYRVHIQIPSRQPDGSYMGMDNLIAETIDRETGLAIESPGKELGLPEGDVEVEILDDDGEYLSLDVKAPAGWVVITAEEFESDEYQNRH